MDGRRRKVDLIELYVTDGDSLRSSPPSSPSSRPHSAGTCDRPEPPKPIHMDPSTPTVDLVTSKDWTLELVVASGPRFRTIDNISASSKTPEEVALTIKDYEQRNVPLVVQDFHTHSNWPEFFTPQWLGSHYGSQSAPTIGLSVQTAGTNLLCLSGRGSQCSWRKAG